MRFRPPPMSLGLRGSFLRSFRKNGLSPLSRLPRRCYATADTGTKETSRVKRMDASEEALKNLEYMQYMGDKVPFDMWAQPVDTFGECIVVSVAHRNSSSCLTAKLKDLHIPSWKSHRKDATWRDHLSAIWQTQRNWYLNASR